MFPHNTRILVVDDMKTMRIVVKKSLAAMELTNVVEADDGTTAWTEIEKALSEQNPFRLIVSDWTMAKMTGLELLKKVRGSQKTKNTPFLMVTAEAEVAQLAEAIAAGVSNYVTKPFTPETIKEKITEIFQRMEKSSHG